MSQYSIMDEFEQGLACIHNAQDLLEMEASREEIMDCLFEALDALAYFGEEIMKLTQPIN